MNINLLDLARTGLQSARYGLTVIGNNINNSNTAGFSRQTMNLGEAGGENTDQGFYGYGVQINGVDRAYDGFLNAQLRDSTSILAEKTARYEQLSQIDPMLGTDYDNPSVQLDQLFNDLKNIQNNKLTNQGAPKHDIEALANKFNALGGKLQDLQETANKKISDSVKDINALTKSLADINGKIFASQNQHGDAPHDLLDLRDQKLQALSQQVEIKVDINSKSGVANVTMNNGLSLVMGDTTHPLTIQPSAEDASETTVAYTDAAGRTSPLPKTTTLGGLLAGQIIFRKTDLASARNQLGQMALVLGDAFNKQNQQGIKSDRQSAGQALFNFDNPKAVPNSHNSGNVSLQVSYTTVSQVKAQDYSVSYDGAHWMVKSKSDGANISFNQINATTLEFDGMKIQMRGTATAGDSFQLSPVKGVLTHIKATGNEIAINNQQQQPLNLEKFLELADKKLVEGKATLTTTFANIVHNVGQNTRSLKNETQTQSILVNQHMHAKDAVVGVNLEEESTNLTKYQQYFQANAQILKTATTIFDTLLNIR